MARRKWWLRLNSAVQLVGGLVVIGLPLATAIAARIPGPHRLACPACFGMREIAERIYVDPVFTHADQRRLLRSIAIGRRTVAAFFGDIKSRPAIVACKTDDCLDVFGGGRAKAVAYAYHAIRMAPGGLNATIATHELSHIELHYRMGLAGLIEPAIPAWFDEGLAVVLSHDKRLPRDVGDQAIRAVLAVRTFEDWRQFNETVGWRAAYGAAAAAVRRLDNRLGRDGLRRFVQRVVGGEDFDAALAAVDDIADKARQ